MRSPTPSTSRPVTGCTAPLQAQVIPNFIPDEIVVDDIAPTLPDAPLLFAGDLSFDKGIPVLLDAYSRLQSPPELGSPVAWEPVRRGPRGLRWLGVVNHDKVVELFNSARVVVVPSVWSDPCPTVVLEAMAAGRPARLPPRPAGSWTWWSTARPGCWSLRAMLGSGRCAGVAAGRPGEGAGLRCRGPRLGPGVHCEWSSRGSRLR